MTDKEKITTKPVWIPDAHWVDDLVSFLDGVEPDKISTKIQVEVDFIKKHHEEAKDFMFECKDQGYDESELILCFLRHETDKERVKRLKSENLNKEVKRQAKLEREKNDRKLYEKLKKKFEEKK